ncbi:PAS domain S-box protein [Methanoculleus sp. FWC-SCC1]|uniref:histidine kinase n=1 Tax=Methanoculleus frigidifontis TaxID=2584085 RepID=A0ABT8M7B1_9EURY|nr:PAS domain S-box protein [Methanoculleus sp. FWC-SCC1]MDN7023811.1 PAS domain S-box protein [Methanoculleus sp. FWC-SCC1]
MTPFPDASAELGPAPQILDLLDEGALLIGHKNRIVWINKALQHCLEVDRDAFCGSDAGEFANRFLLPRIVEEECRGAISASLRDRSNLHALACTIMTADGRERRIRVSSMTGEDNRMRLVRLQDLPGPGAEQEMLATILSYLPETVNILDRDLRYVYVDRGFARQLGREPHEMAGKTWEELGFSAEGAGPYFEKVKEVFATGRGVRGEVRHAVIRDVEYSEYIAVPIPGPSGSVERVLTVSRDITDRKRAERELAHKHELLQTIIDTIPVMITIYDPNLKTFRFNRALRETLGWTEEDATGGDFMALCYPDPGYREMVGRFMQSLEPGWRDFVLTAKDGSRVESSWANIRLSDDTQVGIGIDIRERTAGERALRESEERFRGIYERAGIGIALVGLDGMILDGNPALHQMLGYRPDTLHGRHFADITFPDDLPEDTALMASLVAGGIDTYRIEKRYVAADGQILWGMLTASLIRDEDGSPQSVIGMVENITDRKRMEDALRESEERYRSLVEVLPDAVVVHRYDGTIVYVNPAGVQIAGGRGPEEIVGRSIYTFVHPEYRDLVANRIRRILEEGTAIPVFEQVLLTTVGQTIWVEITATPILYQGEPSIMVVYRDITERKQAEEALFLAKEYNRALIEASIDPFVTIDPEGRVTDVNAATEKVTGYSREELIGTDVSGYTTDPDRARAGIRKVFVDGELRDYPLEIRHRDGGATPALFNAAVYRDAQGQVAGIFAAARDITERKQAEAALREQADELGRVNRELDAAHREANLYLDILTHDVRNANNVSTMYADLLLGLLAGEPKAYAQKLHESIWRSTEILRNVAAIRRIHQESAELSPVDLDAVIREEIGTFPAASIRYDGRPVLVSADGLLSMVFTNLIGNAVKFGGPDVRITVRVEDRDGEVLVSVEDTGPGIPDEVKGVLFRRFERGLGHGRGEGLGLYIVRTLIERYGGTVWIEDRVPGKPGEGAAFRFTLVRALQDEAAAVRTNPGPREGNRAESHAPACGDLRAFAELVTDAVLVAEDAGDLREANHAASALLGYTREELLQRPVSALCRDREAGREFWQEFLKRGALQGECELLRKDGTTINVEYSAAARIAPGIHVVAIRPVPGQTEMEGMLQFERDQLLSIFDGLEEIVYVADPATHEILYANPFFTKALGRDVVGGICYREFQGLAAPCPFCTNEIILRQKPQPYRWEYYNPVLDVHLDIVDRIIRWPDGRDVRLEVAIDITERKRAERALQESEGQFRALLDATPEGTLLIDRDGTILALNEAMAARFGKSAEDLRETCVYDLFPPDLAAARKRQVDEAFASARPNRLTDEYAGRFFDVILFPIRSADGQVKRLAVISSDVTDRKQVEEIRREAFDRIERNMEQFAILGDHVRHPLQVLLARADLMDDPETAEKIREQVRRINGYIKDLDQGWIESRKIREFLLRNELV